LLTNVVSNTNCLLFVTDDIMSVWLCIEPCLVTYVFETNWSRCSGVDVIVTEHVS